MIEAAFAEGKLIVRNHQSVHDPNNPKAVQQEQTLMEVKHAKPTEVEMAHFIECIRTGRKPLTDPVGSFEGLQVIWKLYEAEEMGQLADLRGLGLGSLTL
jgi:predicted dehydrogenase